MQRDPLGYATSPHLYQYVASNPGIQIDPSGLTTGGILEIPISISIGVLIVIVVLLIIVLNLLGQEISRREEIRIIPRANLWDFFCRVREWFPPIPPPPIDDLQKEKCKLIGSGGCNKKKGLKRCTYSCPRGKVEGPIPCGPGNWDPPCPGWDGSEVEL